MMAATLKGTVGSVLARMTVQAKEVEVEAKVQQTAQNSEHMAMRCNRKSLILTVARGSHFSRCGNLCLLTIPRSNARPQMPPHIHNVYQPSEPSKELIAKKVHKESNELVILKRLNTIQPKSEHVVSLLDSFHGQSGPWVILPRLSSITEYIVIAPEQLESKVTQVFWGLIKGLAYLHELCIAHRDIKPNNLVVDQEFCLKIIDFDIAMQLKDEDEEVDDKCGTKYWMAPEVEKKSTMYVRLGLTDGHAGMFFCTFL